MRIYCDANIFIEALEGFGSPAQRLEDIFSNAGRKALTLVTSALTVAETLQKPLEWGDQKLIIAYLILLSNDRSGLIHTIDIDRSILAEAAFVRARRKSLKLPDAIHIATAERAGCTQFLSRDQRLAGATTLPVLDLGPNSLGRFLEFPE